MSRTASSPPQKYYRVGKALTDPDFEDPLCVETFERTGECPMWCVPKRLKSGEQACHAGPGKMTNRVTRNKAIDVAVQGMIDNGATWAQIKRFISKEEPGDRKAARPAQRRMAQRRPSQNFSSNVAAEYKKRQGGTSRRTASANTGAGAGAGGNGSRRAPTRTTAASPTMSRANSGRVRTYAESKNNRNASRNTRSPTTGAGSRTARTTTNRGANTSRGRTASPSVSRGATQNSRSLVRNYGAGTTNRGSGAGSRGAGASTTNRGANGSRGSRGAGASTTNRGANGTRASGTSGSRGVGAGTRARTTQRADYR